MASTYSFLDNTHRQQPSPSINMKYSPVIFEDEVQLRADRRRNAAIWKALFAAYLLIITAGCALLYIVITGTVFKNLPSKAETAAAAPVSAPFNLHRRSWGGFDERPLDDRCYRQERTAMILSFILGSIGVDQWYAHHWVLAVFKTLVGLGSWIIALLALLFRPRRHGEDGNASRGPFRSLCTGFVTLWWFIDVILWMVGGVYGTPGCPGGNEWRY